MRSRKSCQLIIVVMKSSSCVCLSSGLQQFIFTPKMLGGGEIGRKVLVKERLTDLQHQLDRGLE